MQAPAGTLRLFGHEDAQAFLAANYRSAKGHHAILIEGPAGIGKATLAFRFANHVLTHPDPARAPDQMADPEADSPVTRQIAAGASHNLLHLTRPLDDKKERLKTAITVDEVRRVGKFLTQTSGNGNWRIVIIDPADDLNRNAANALLKFLEEPPKRAMFLVLAHAPGRLLPTIRSRCMPLRLLPLRPQPLALALGNLGIPVSGDDGQRLIGAANGSVGEALTLVNHGGLDIVAAFEKALTAETAGSRPQVHKLAEVLSARDAAVIFDYFCLLADRSVTGAAREAAIAGDLARADRLARLSVTLRERLATSQAYNLDRKQTILSVLDDLRDGIAA